MILLLNLAYGGALDAKRKRNSNSSSRLRRSRKRNRRGDSNSPSTGTLSSHENRVDDLKEGEQGILKISKDDNRE